MEAQIYRAFILCHGSLQETIFYLNIECLQRSCCSLETGDYEIIFCKNPIQKNLTVTFINSSLFKCSQGSYRAIERCFSSLRVCCLLLLFTTFKKLLVQLQPVSVVSDNTT